MICQEGLDTLIAVLVEGTIVNAGGGDDTDLQAGFRGGGVISGGVILCGVCTAATGSQRQNHCKGQEQCCEFLAYFHLIHSSS